MRYFSNHLPVLILAAVLLVTPVGSALPVNQADLPDRVQSTLKDQKIEINIRSIDERSRSGENLYDVEFVVDSTVSHLVIAESGKIVQDSRLGTYRPPIADR